MKLPLRTSLTPPRQTSPRRARRGHVELGTLAAAALVLVLAGLLPCVQDAVCDACRVIESFAHLDAWYRLLGIPSHPLSQ